MGNFSWEAVREQAKSELTPDLGVLLDKCDGELRDDVLFVYAPTALILTRLASLYDTSNALMKASGATVRFMIRSDNRLSGLNAFAAEVHQNAVKHGFWDPAPSFGDTLSLIHSELSEALEAYRDGEPMCHTVNGKPEGIAVEMADAIIRLLDWFGKHPELDLEAILRTKHEYNQSRPYRHGGKKL